MTPGSPSSFSDSKESRLCFLENESLMDCLSSGDAQSSLACELMPIFPYPEGHIINTSSQSQETDNVMPYPYRSITSYKHHFLKACHSQDTEKPISQNFVHTVAQTVANNRSRNLLYPVQFDGSCIPPASEDAGYGSYIPSNNLIPSSPAKYASLSSAYPHELPVDLSVLSPGHGELGNFLGYAHGIDTSLNPWNASLNPEVSSHRDSHVANEKVLGVDGLGESMHVTGNSEKFPQNPEHPIEFSHASGAAVPNKKHDRLSRTGSKQDNVRRAANGHNSFGVQHENSNVSRCFQTESATPLAVPGKRSNKDRIQSGKPSLGPQNKHAQNKMHSADAVERSRNQTAKAKKYTAEAIKKTGNKLSSAPQQIWQVKGKGEPSQVSSKSLLKVWQVKKSGVPSKDSSSKVNRSKKKTEASNDSAKLLWRVKEKTQPPSKKSSSRRKRNTSKHQIKWDGDDENDKPVGHNCCLCENDLAFPPIKPDIQLEFHNFADVAILPCCHTFHIECLEVAMSEEQLKDPSCFLCLSEE